MRTSITAVINVSCATNMGRFAETISKEISALQWLDKNESKIILKYLCCATGLVHM